MASDSQVPDARKSKQTKPAESESVRPRTSEKGSEPQQELTGKGKKKESGRARKRRRQDRAQRKSDSPVPDTATASHTQEKGPAKSARRSVESQPAAAAKATPRRVPTESNSSAPAAEPADGSPVSHSHHHRFLLFAAIPSWVTSMLIHVAILLLLAFITLPETHPSKQIVTVSTPADTQQLEKLDEPEIEPVPIQELSSDAPVAMESEQTPEDTVPMPEFTDSDAAPLHVELQDLGDLTAPSTDLTNPIGRIGGTGLQGRGGEARKAMLRKYGGSKGSEAAVANALAWLAAHQMNDGGWDFDHTRGPCKGRCSHPGIGPPARNAATAMALLPFLGAGQTHKEGKYKANVERGLAYLIKHIHVRKGMGDFLEPGGNMYSHGLASITLCEAYAMTNDPGLLKPAQMALNFIVYAQHPVDGGWRYQPKQPGDTSVTGWQIMALKSGHMGYLKVPRNVLLGASKFLDFVQADNGAKYGYTLPDDRRPSTTSVGLLCRMYLGWSKDKPALKAGVEYLHEIGPSANMYYNYYATQVLRQYGGQYWKDWNKVMRDRLVKSQETKGHAKGSWYFSKAPHAQRGGRLYCTSLAAMILEVYYRYMPLYGKEATEEEFPL